jgi:SOS-response transcriptional repressor LexA
VIYEFTQWVMRRRRRYRVSGASMEPDLHDAELILIEPTDVVGVGDVVVCRHPFAKFDIVKRVAAAAPDGYFELASPSGTDSTQFGLVPRSLIRGRVTASLTRRCVFEQSNDLQR